MAHHPVTSSDLPVNGDHLSRNRVASLSLIFGVVALIGLLASTYLLFIAPEEARGKFAYSWVFGLFYFMTLAIGGCFWTLLHNAANASWGTSVRRVFENLGSVFPWLGLLAIPLLIPSVQHYLYEWMNVHRTPLAPGETLKTFLHHENHLLYAKKWFLSIPFWTVRVIFYFVGLGAVILYLRHLSAAQDTDPNPGVKRLFASRRLSGPALVIFAITITFAGYDMLLGMDYTWFSTMWGVYMFAGTAVSSMAVIIILVTWLRSMGHLQKVVTEEHYHVMGKLLFAFTVFWAYIGFSQYFLIWYANITEETRYFLIRNTDGWNNGNYVLLFGHFALPFVLLLPAWVKRTPKFVVPICFWILLMHLVDLYIVVIPERGFSLGYINKVFGDIQPSIPGAFWYDALAFVTVGAFFCFILLRAFKRHALFPHRDPRILESANISN